MTEYGPIGGRARDSWGRFVAHAAEYGASLETERTKHENGQEFVYEALIRRDADRIRKFPLPYKYDPKKTMGPGMMIHVCGILGIPEPKQWPMVM